jgi:PAS domain-containing protein
VAPALPRLETAEKNNDGHGEIAEHDKLSLGMKIKAPKEIRFVFLCSFLLLGIWVVESSVAQLFGDQTLAPLLSIISFVVIAAIFNHFYVLIALFPFCLLSYWLISDSSQYPIIRTLTLGLAGILAAWAAWQKACLDRQVREFEVVIMNLPFPWILSDPNGNILRASPLFASLAGKTQAELVGAPHFSLLASPENQESPVVSIGVFGKCPKLQIHPFISPNAPQVYKASYVPVVIHKDHCLLTILGQP